MFLSFSVFDYFFRFKFFFWFLCILGPPYCGIGATIRIGRDIRCLSYAGFFLYTFPEHLLDLYYHSKYFWVLQMSFKTKKLLSEHNLFKPIGEFICPHIPGCELARRWREVEERGTAARGWRFPILELGGRNMSSTLCGDPLAMWP